jgi:uncharacterized protein YqgQ
MDSKEEKMQDKIDELKRLYDNGIIDRKTYTMRKLQLIDEMLKGTRETVRDNGPDTGC